MSLAQIIDHITSDKLKQRSDGVNELKECLIDLEIDAKTGQRLFEALFINISREIDNWLAKKSSLNEGRLINVAEVIRRLVELKVDILKPKAIQRLIERIRKCSRVNSTDQFVDPVIPPFAKICVILSKPEFVEQLPINEWKLFTTFCFNMVNIFVKHYKTADDNNNKKTQRVPASVGDYLHSAYNLTNCNSRSSTDQYEDYFASCATFLQTYRNETTQHVYIFGILNILLPSLQTRNLQSIYQILDFTFDILPDLLNCKDYRLRTQILIYIMHSAKSLEYIFTFVNQSSHLQAKVLNVLEMLLNNSSQHARLQDVGFNCRAAENDPDTWMNFRWLKRSSSDNNYWLTSVACYRLLCLCANIGKFFIVF